MFPRNPLVLINLFLFIDATYKLFEDFSARMIHTHKHIYNILYTKTIDRFYRFSQAEKNSANPSQNTVNL